MELKVFWTRALFLRLRIRIAQVSEPWGRGHCTGFLVLERLFPFDKRLDSWLRISGVVLRMKKRLEFRT